MTSAATSVEVVVRMVPLVVTRPGIMMVIATAIGENWTSSIPNHY